MDGWAIGSVVAAAASFVAGCASGLAYARRGAPPAPPPPEHEASTWAEIDYEDLAGGPAEEPAAQPARDGELIGICIDIANRLRDDNPALWERLNERLAKVGVDAVVPDGEPFDPEVYDAVDRQPTDDPARHLTVASTLFAGYSDRGTWVRRPEVIVYVNEDPAEETAK
ncbi:nucleotide exchange factor GrpE [Sphaerimonospora cavernae]|uniref:Nucleotide exchange factor GrpE n=1 Tax=Sphaerimonospora cavernae TaxID=1740611 RepID=A0ABV6U5U1_9ACTN